MLGIRCHRGKDGRGGRALPSFGVPGLPMNLRKTMDLPPPRVTYAQNYAHALRGPQTPCTPTDPPEGQKLQGKPALGFSPRDSVPAGDGREGPDHLEGRAGRRRGRQRGVGRGRGERVSSAFHQCQGAAHGPRGIPVPMAAPAHHRDGSPAVRGPHHRAPSAPHGCPGPSDPSRDCGMGGQVLGSGLVGLPVHVSYRPPGSLQKQARDRKT